MEEWFKWEREATPHSTYWFFEGVMKQMRANFGVTWPSTFLIYRGSVVHWRNSLDGLKKVGHALIGKHLSLKSVSGIERKMRKETEALTKAIAEVEAADLESLSDDALSSLYRRFQGEFADWGGATAATSEPMAYAGEEEIEDMLAGRGLEGNEKKRLKSLLTATTKESYTLRQMRELLEIAEKYGIRKGNFKRKVKEPRILSAIAAHAKRYHWMHNGYLTTYVLGSAFFHN